MAPIVPLALSIGGGILGSSLGAGVGTSLLGGAVGGGLGSALGSSITGKKPSATSVGLGALGGAATPVIGGALGIERGGAAPFATKFGTSQAARMAPVSSVLDTLVKGGTDPTLAAVLASQSARTPALTTIAQSTIPTALTLTAQQLLKEPQQQPFSFGPRGAEAAVGFSRAASQRLRQRLSALRGGGF